MPRPASVSARELAPEGAWQFDPFHAVPEFPRARNATS